MPKKGEEGNGRSMKKQMGKCQSQGQLSIEMWPGPLLHKGKRLFSPSLRSLSCTKKTSVQNLEGLEAKVTPLMGTEADV